MIKKICNADPVLLSGGGFNPVLAKIVHELLKDGSLSNILDGLNAEFTLRAEALFQELVNQFGDTIEFDRPAGGYFVWVRFKDGTDCGKFRDFLLEEDNKNKFGVGFLHGERCKVSDEEVMGLEEGRFGNFLRLSWAFYEVEEIMVGVARLKRGWEAFRGAVGEVGGEPKKTAEGAVEAGAQAAA